MTGFDHRQADFGVGEFPPPNPPAPTAFYGAVPTIPVREIILAAAALVSSTLYLAGVIAIAVAWDNHVAAITALATAGVCYLCYMVQMATVVLGAGGRTLALGLVVLSFVTGALAGLSLIVGV